MSHKGLNIVITGANSGVGFQTMKNLYLKGNNVIFGSRNEAKNQEAITLVMQQSKKTSSTEETILKSFPLDLSKRQSIDKFVKSVKDIYKHIDILINNAGLVSNKLQKNESGIQMTLATNHFGHFYLTYLVFDMMKQRPEARIISVSSMLHFDAHKNPFNDINCETHSFSSMQQYNLSKFMNVVFTKQLATKIQKYQNVKACSLHPGLVASNFGSDYRPFQIFNCLYCCLFVNNQQGSRTSVYLATQDFKKLKNGEYYHSDTKHKQMDQRAKDPQLRQKLWKMSEQAYKIKFQP